MNWFDHLGSDLVAFLLSIGIVGAYHVYLHWRLRHDPRYTIQSVNNAARASWVESIMTTSGKDVLAVQTLRNSTMAATFLASTAVLLIIGVLNLGQAGKSSDGILQSLTSHHYGTLLYLLKLTPLLVDLFAAFLFFTLAIRMYNHVGYLVNCRHPGLTPRYVSRLLNRGGAYYSLGMRSYYLAVPLLFWLFSPLLMVAASVALIVIFYHVDRAPDAFEEASLESFASEGGPTLAWFRRKAA